MTSVIAWIVKVTEPMPSKWERRENKVRSKRDGNLSRKIMNRSRDKVKTRENSKAFSKEMRKIQKEIEQDEELYY